MAESALMEATGNILANAYLNAFSEKLDLKIKDTIPYIGTDMLNSLMDGVLSKFAAHASETLLLKNNFRIDEYSINGHAFILFDPASFELIAEKVKAYKE
jgi:chemotaxis protein CheC